MDDRDLRRRQRVPARCRWVYRTGRLYGLVAENASRIVVCRSVGPSAPIVSRKKPPWRTCAVESQSLNAHWALFQDSWITYTTL